MEAETFPIRLGFKGWMSPEEAQRSAEDVCFSVIERLLWVKRVFIQPSVVTLGDTEAGKEIPSGPVPGRKQEELFPGDLAGSILTQPALQVGKTGCVSASKQPGDGRLVTGSQLELGCVALAKLLSLSDFHTCKKKLRKSFPNLAMRL